MTEGSDMIIENRVTMAAQLERVWEILLDVPAVSRCVPGVVSVTALADGNYAGILEIRIGPIKTRLEGTLALAEQDRDAWQARMDVRATDRRLGGAVNAKVTMRLRPAADGGTELAVHTDAAVLGKLGQFGQAVIKRQADEMMATFARNLSSEIDRVDAGTTQ
jgi:carbon monoxide dehydrogenase subunit G